MKITKVYGAFLTQWKKYLKFSFNFRKNAKNPEPV